MQEAPALFIYPLFLYIRDSKWKKIAVLYQIILLLSAQIGESRFLSFYTGTEVCTGQGRHYKKWLQLKSRSVPRGSVLPAPGRPNVS